MKQQKTQRKGVKSENLHPVAPPLRVARGKSRRLRPIDRSLPRHRVDRFAGVTCATVGYGDIVLPKEWRLFGPVEG
jgi:hypothetical protein